MLNKRKLSVLSALVLIVGVGLASCGPTDGTSATTTDGGGVNWSDMERDEILDLYVTEAAKETGTLTVGCSTEDETFLNEAITKFKEAFPELANVEIVVNNQVGEADAYKALQADLDEAPDLMLSADDQVMNAIGSNFLSPVPGGLRYLIEDEILETAVEAVTIGENLYGYSAVSGNAQVLLYNKKLISETDARSLDKILEIAKENNMNFYYPMAEGWYVCNWLWLNGGDFWIEPETTTDPATGMTTTTFTQTTDMTVEDVRKVGDTINKYYTDYSGTLLSTTGSDIQANLQDGFSNETTIGGISWNNYDGIKAAMKTAGFSDEEINETVGIAPLPTVTYDGKEGTQLEGFDGYKVYIVKSITNRPVTAHLLGYYLSAEDCQLLHYQTRNYIPTNLVVSNMDEVKSSEVAKALAAQSKFAHSQAKAITAQAVWDALSTYGPAFAVSGAVDEETASTAVDNLVGALGGVVK